jgi:hypothetical protein
VLIGTMAGIPSPADPMDEAPDIVVSAAVTGNRNLTSWRIEPWSVFFFRRQSRVDQGTPWALMPRTTAE